MKKKSLRLALEIGLIIAVIVGFVLINEQITENKKSSFVPIKDDVCYAYQIESINTVNDDMIIEGWFFELKKDRNIEKEIPEDRKMGLILYDLNYETEKDLDGHEKPRKGLSCNVEYRERNDVNDYFKCEYDYSHCGFVAKIRKSDLNIIDGKYQIVIKPEMMGEKGILISAYLMDGKLCYTDYRNHIDLKVEGTDLSPIVSKGTLVGDYPDHKICVYQYENKLYWIAEDGYQFDEDGGTYIQYQFYTTQFDKLPKERTLAGHFFDNIGADFERYEVEDTFNTGQYRVSVRDIPTEYAVVRIETGYYSNKKWIWHGLFCPQYNFRN